MFEGLDRRVHDWRVKRSLNGKRLGLLYTKVTGVLLNEFQGLGGTFQRLRICTAEACSKVFSTYVPHCDLQ